MGKKSIKMTWTPTDIGRLLNTDATYVRVKLIKAGRLPIEPYPGMREYRVHRNTLRRFLEKYRLFEALKVLDEEEGIHREYPDPFEDPPSTDLHGDDEDEEDEPPHPRKKPPRA